MAHLKLNSGKAQCNDALQRGCNDKWDDAKKQTNIRTVIQFDKDKGLEMKTTYAYDSCPLTWQTQHFHEI